MQPPSPDPICPNCRQPYRGDPQFCPHCGFNLQPIPQPKFVAGSQLVDIILSLLMCIVCGATVIGMLIPLITFFVIDKRYDAFRLGLKIGLIIFAVIILGALAFCGIMIIAMSNNH